eukprot:PhF_6_TR12932/c0_g1_i1/m.20408
MTSPPQKVGPQRLEDIPATLMKFDIPAVLLARHVKKVTSKKSKSDKVFTLQPHSVYICSGDGVVSRYVPLANVRNIQCREREILLKVHNDADLMIDFVVDKRNKSNELDVVLKALEEFVRKDTGLNISVENMNAGQKLTHYANLQKSDHRPHPMQQLKSETKRVLEVSKVKYDAVEMELQGKVATTIDGKQVVEESMPPAAAARQKALEAEVAYLRQRLAESEQLRVLQSQVDQMQRLLFEKSNQKNVAGGTGFEAIQDGKSVVSPARIQMHLRKPHMPDYIPGSLGSLSGARSLQLQHSAFSFSGNKDMWSNLVRVVSNTTRNMAPPLFTVSASHSGDTVLVGMDFLRDFLLGWREFNAHYVKVIHTKENESIEFYATREFWRFAQREHDVLLLQRQQSGEDRVDDLNAVTIQCDGSEQIIRSTLLLWNELVERWEAANASTLKKLSAGSKTMLGGTSVTLSPERRLYL